MATNKKVRFLRGVVGFLITAACCFFFVVLASFFIFDILGVPQPSASGLGKILGFGLLAATLVASRRAFDWFYDDSFLEITKYITQNKMVDGVRAKVINTNRSNVDSEKVVGLENHEEQSPIIKRVSNLVAWYPYLFPVLVTLSTIFWNLGLRDMSSLMEDLWQSLTPDFAFGTFTGVISYIFLLWLICGILNYLLVGRFRLLPWKQ